MHGYGLIRRNLRKMGASRHVIYRAEGDIGQLATGRKLEIGKFGNIHRHLGVGSDTNKDAHPSKSRLFLLPVVSQYSLNVASTLSPVPSQSLFENSSHQ